MDSNELIAVVRDKEAPMVNDSLKYESEQMMKDEKDEDGDLVTPWDVTASSKKGIDYDKLIG
ncbi:hypothetical protein WUBG_06247 [Wuchereria bancrofti]|uniref:Uncharacterized protein n=1 Tax=Wuchereria bancrofti TaxID=6293 RepID=J9EK45_WUCBA|nr:hypothetical protein WUBG_06247 [Wuchereria bancrofti]